MRSALELKVFLAGRVAVEAGGVLTGEERFPARQGRLLFAYLVAEQGRPVPRDELADALWGETPPATWEKALTVIMSKLRSLLAECGLDGATVLTSAFGCYRLNLPEGSWIDIIAAADALREAEAALAADDLEHAKATASRAASLARPPFLPGEEGAWVEGKRRELSDILRRALSCLAEASLRSGDEVEAAKWAEETIALEPYRETGYRHLMAAHAAAGNRAEALPAGAIVVAAVVVPLLAFDGSSETAVAANSVVALNASGSIVATVPVGARPVAITSGAGALWVANLDDQSVTRVDTSSRRVVRNIPIGDAPTALAATGSAVWVTDGAGDVSKIDPRYDRLTSTRSVAASGSFFRGTVRPTLAAFRSIIPTAMSRESTPIPGGEWDPSGSETPRRRSPQARAPSG